jgi:hypothetical protein
MNDRDDQGRDQGRDQDHDQGRARAQDASRATSPGRRRLLGAAAGAALAGQAAPLFAQASYPSRPWNGADGCMRVSYLPILDRMWRAALFAVVGIT